MSEREEVPFLMDETTMPHFAVLREFEEPVAWVARHRMADEIVRLRSQLAAVKIELDNSRYHSHMVTQARIEWENAAERYERERDEARRERDTAVETAQLAVARADEFEREHRSVTSEYMKMRHRAERMERVVEAVRDYFNGEPTDDTLYAAWCAYSRDSSSVRALDATTPEEDNE